MTTLITEIPVAATRHEAPSVKLPKPATILALVYLGGAAFMAIFADYLPVRPPLHADGAVDGVAASNFKLGPGRDRWFGTDQLGQGRLRQVHLRRPRHADRRRRGHVRRAHRRRHAGRDGRLLQGADRPGDLVRHRGPARPAGADHRHRAGVPLRRPEEPVQLARLDGPHLADHGSCSSLLSIAPLARIVRAQTLSLSRARVRARGAQPRRQGQPGDLPGDPARTSCRP